MPRIDEMPEYRARLSRTTHDLSHKFGFTATVAHLLPVFHDFLNPGETVELGFNYNLRTQPLQSAAMVDIKSHVEYFFVPMFLLYEPFGDMMENIVDRFSSLYPKPGSAQTVSSVLPVMDFNNVVKGAMQAEDSRLIGFEEWMNHVYRLFDMLGYNNSDINFTGGSNRADNPSVFPYPILAYNCIYQYYYRLDTRERFNQHVFNWDQYFNDLIVDYSNQGNLTVDPWDFIRLYYRPKDSDYFTDAKVSPIVDVLNLNNKTSLMLADSWLTRSKVGTDPLLTSGGVGTESQHHNTYAPTGATFNNPGSQIQTEFGFRAESVISVSSVNGIPQNGSDINTANIRALFANEKLNSITGRARKHYDDQVLAHYGFKVPHDPKHEISCFGHDRGLIHIGEVISTADTANAALGEIAGKGYGNLQVKPHKFTAPCHGVVMAILSFVPDITYSNTYLKANAVTDRNSFYQPEYDALGMQPLFGYEGEVTDRSNWNRIVAWQYRYEQWKRRFNRVSKAFAGVGSLDSWMLDFKAPHGSNGANINNFLEYLHSPQELNQIMLVNYVDSAIAPQSEGDLNESHIYDGDPFVIDGFIHCKKVSSMSDYSLPRLDA